LSQLQLQFRKVSLSFSEGNGLHPPFWMPIFGFFIPSKMAEDILTKECEHPRCHLEGYVHLNQNEAHHYHPTQLLALHQAPRVHESLSWQSLGMIFLGPFLAGTVDGGEKSAAIPVDGKDPIIYMFVNLSQLVQDF